MSRHSGESQNPDIAEESRHQAFAGVTCDVVPPFAKEDFHGRAYAALESKEMVEHQRSLIAGSRSICEIRQFSSRARPNDPQTSWAGSC